MNSALQHGKTRRDLSKYNPEKGLKTIAVAEAAEKHYARAKDPSMLYSAIEAKLTAQAEFVDWWDAQGNKGGGDHRRRSATVLIAGKNGIPDRYIIERWRKKLADPTKFQTELGKAQQRCVQIVEAQKKTAEGAHVGHNSGENEWYTPAEYIEAARVVLGDIDLDPASCEAANEVVKAAQIFTIADDGLAQPWHGRVWMNPPYSQPAIELFANKFTDSVEAGDVVAGIVLVNNATETNWFQTLAGASSAMCFPRGRVRFWSPNKESATPLQGQAVLYAGANVDAFCEQFSSFGILARIGG